MAGKRMTLSDAVVSCISVAAAFCLGIINICCDRIIDPFRPFSHSTADLTGWVRDSATGEAVEGALVVVEGKNRSAATDSAGKFAFRGIPTGQTFIVITAEDYYPRHCAIDVTLEPRPLNCALIRKDRPPVIEHMIVDSSRFRFAGDSLRLFFRASDFSGGIAEAVLYTGDTAGGGTLILRFDPPLYTVTDSFTFAYLSKGTFNGSLEIVDSRGEKSVDSFTISASRPRRPFFKLLRVSAGGFTSGEPGYLQWAVADPDSVFGHLSIEWSEGESGRTDLRREGVCWHTYTEERSTSKRIGVTLFGKDSRPLIDTFLTVTVKKIDPPLLDARVFFSPCQYCSPQDTAILIGVRILQIYENWVRQIVWSINENDSPPVSAYYRMDYDTLTGAVSDSVGNLFVHRFNTATFKRTNEVKILVVDGTGNSSSVSGFFYMAGRAE